MNIELRSLPKNENFIFEYAFYKTKLGDLLIASWKNSLVYVAFATNQKVSLKEMKERFLKSEFLQKETATQKKLVKYLANPKKFNGILFVATNGTPFQVKVWEMLLKVPFGKTCFYSDLAKKIGSPSAVRAAASAVAKNPIAILIPCHRVLPRGGGVGNYHWGAKNKNALLTWESLAK
jgi:AraC family transcriptional regulator of adaptative response/methylated-DNA-[protein]-cysteine methyltransferase